METINSSISSSEARAAWRLLVRLVALAPILALVVGVNLGVDPACLYRDKEYESGLAAILVSGRNAANVGNHDERLVRKYMARMNREPPTTLVLGSSRAMLVGADAISGGRTLNACVSGAVLEDILGLYEAYRSRHALPRRLVLGLDPWLLNRHHGETRWTSIREDSFRLLERLGIVPGTAKISRVDARFANLFSLSYFQAGVRELVQRWRQPGATEATYYPTDETEGHHGIRLADGTLAYDEAFRLAAEDPAAVRKQAVDYATVTPVYHMKDFIDMDPELLRLLEGFLDLVAADGVETVLFLPPYHPETWRILTGRPDTKIVVEVEECFRGLAARRGLRLLGSYDARRCGLDETRFYDGMHLKRDAVRELFRSIAGAPPDVL